MNSPRPKRLYLARRHPGLSREAFKVQWRAHGLLAMHFMARQQWENVMRYAHCDALAPDAAGGFDGVGMVWFRDLAARRRHLQFAEARAALKADEDRVFAEHPDRSGLVCDEHVLLDAGTARIGLIRVLSRRSDLASEGFVRDWREEQERALIGSIGPDLLRYVQNTPLPPENGISWGLECDLIDELWFADVDALHAAMRRSPAVVALHDDDRFDHAPTLIVVEQVLLHPR
ncbi:MAG: EthD domain-containing protein [Lautropia sp.]